MATPLRSRAWLRRRALTWKLINMAWAMHVSMRVRPRSMVSGVQDDGPQLTAAKMKILQGKANGNAKVSKHASHRCELGDGVWMLGVRGKGACCVCATGRRQHWP
jgi:hypothetical protein